MRDFLKRRNWVLYFLLALFVLCVIGATVTDDHVWDARLQKTSYEIMEPDKVEDAANGKKRYYFELEYRSDVNNTLLFYTNHQVVRAYLDGTQIYSLDRSKSPFGRTTGAVWNTIGLPQKAKTLRIEVTPVYKNTEADVDVFIRGNGVKMFKDILGASFGDVVICMTLLVVGVGLVMYWLLVFRKANMQKEVLYMGLFATLFGVWTFGETGFAMLLLQNRPFASYLAFTCLMGMIPPFILFTKEFLGVRNKWMHRALLTYSVGIAVLCQILHLTGIAGLKQTVILIHIGIGLSLLYLLYAIVEAFVTEHDRKRVYVNIIGLFLLIFTAVMDLSSYYSDKIGTSQIGKLGFLAYILLLGYQTAIRAQSKLQEAQKVEVYREMAEKDMLTHCYNRNAYAKDTGNMTELTNVSVVTFDLNDLKKCNDFRGHIAGDRYISDAAKIIQEVYDRMGRLYRIGGDEFCVIVEDATDKKLDKLRDELLERSLDYRAKTGDDNFGIACGYAQYDSQIDKSIEDIRNRADEYMYENKKKIKGR